VHARSLVKAESPDWQADTAVYLPFLTELRLFKASSLVGP